MNDDVIDIEVLDFETWRQVSDRITHIRKYPGLHHHTFDDLSTCSYINDMFIADVLSAHKQYAPVRINNDGTRCDVTLGPCSCNSQHLVDVYKWP